MFIFRTLLCPSMEVEGMATIAAEPLSQKVGPLPGTWSWDCAVELQEEPEKERHRIKDGVWSQAEISTSYYLSSHRGLRGRSGLNVSVIDKSPGR